jgi:branched-chain amino acid transport system ATP-binding protein
VSLRIEGVTVARGGREVVRDVSLEIPPGEVTALLGPNGAGKSSLVLAVAGVLPVESGTVTVGERRLTGRRPEKVRAAGVAVVPEGRRLLPELTVEDNLQVATYALPQLVARERRGYALELFPELKARLDAKGRSLSGGEQQMVVLAQVVLKRLIPTISTVAESGVGVLLIEQFATVALGLANRAYVLEGGSIRFSGLAQELRDKPELLESAYLLRGAG